MTLPRLLLALFLFLPLCGEARPPADDEITRKIDFALSSGDLELAWDHFTTALMDAHADADVSGQLVLLDKGMDLCLLMNFPQSADQLYMRAKSLGLLKIPEWRIRGFLMKSRIQFAFGNYRQMQLMLDKASDFVDAGTTQNDLALLFAQRALYSWLTHQFSAANEYIEAVLLKADDNETGYASGVALMVRALLIEDQGKNSRLIDTNLELSLKAFTLSGYPIAFYALLARVISLNPGMSIRSVEEPFLEFSKHGDRYSNSWISSHALLSEAELLRRSGNYTNAIDLFQRAIAFNQLTHEENENLELEWRLLSNAMGFSQPVTAKREFPVHWVILTMLLVLFLLILLLRIHTQRIINEKLVESVEKSLIAEQAAEQASRLKSQFVANVSHEIKNPMNGLVGMTSLLEELVKDPVQKKYLGTIRQCSNNLLVLMNDLLDLGRIDANKLEIDKHPFETREVFSYCENIVRLRAQEKGLKLMVEVDPDIPGTIIGDSTRLSQIIVNLLNNAIKFTTDGWVSMNATFCESIANAGNLIVTVSDSGQGIQAGRLGTVFEPFNQSSSVPEASESGSGLGLAICKRLTDHMGGTLVAESEYGKGSRFTLTLPVSVPAMTNGSR